MMDATMLMLLAEVAKQLEELALYDEYTEIPAKYVKLAHKLAEEESDFYNNWIDSKNEPAFILGAGLLLFPNLDTNLMDLSSKKHLTIGS